MRACIVAAVLLCSSAAYAQHGYNYPAWQTPVYQQGYDYDGYWNPYGGTIYQQRIGNFDFYEGDGAFSGFSGHSINFGRGFRQTQFRYRPRYSRYGW